MKRKVILLNVLLMGACVLSSFTFLPAVPTNAAVDVTGQGASNTTAAQSQSSEGWLTAIGIPEGRLIPTVCTEGVTIGQCGLNQVFQVIVNFTQILLALAGSVAILMFVYGGTMMIVSGTSIRGSGDSKKTINRGKDAIFAAVTGLVVMLGAWLVVNFTILAITQGQVGGTATIFGKPFNQKPTGLKN